MTWKLKADVIQALDDWKVGKPVRSVELGHIHRMKESNEPTLMPSIDMSKHIHRDQERAHAYCFHLIELFQLNGLPDDHEKFLEACDDFERSFDWGELPVQDRDVFNAERDAAEGLAWKVLIVGWKRAIEGHADSAYITVTNPAPQQKENSAAKAGVTKWEPVKDQYVSSTQRIFEIVRQGYRLCVEPEAAFLDEGFRDIGQDRPRITVSREAATEAVNSSLMRRMTDEEVRERVKVSPKGREFYLMVM